jgi:hypothetical protein
VAVTALTANVSICYAELLKTKDGLAYDFDNWNVQLKSAMAHRNNIWFAIVPAQTSAQLYPKMLEWGDILQPWMQWVTPGTTKLSIIGQLNKGDRSLIGALVIRPYSYHTPMDNWKATDVFATVKEKGIDYYRNTDTYYGISPDGSKFDIIDYGSAIMGTTAMNNVFTDFAAGKWGMNHMWPFVYDALYSFIYGIDSLLQEGTPVSDIKGEILRDAVFKQDFTGVSKDVKFIEGKRPGDWAIDNFRSKDDGGWMVSRVGSLVSKKLEWVPAAEVVFMDGSSWLAGSSDISAVPKDRFPRCSDGQTRDTKGICNLCPEGKYANANTWNRADPEREECMACSAGMFSASAGASVCSSCSAGKTSALGSSTCQNCAVGSFSVSGGLCGSCQVGFYQPAAGASVCIPASVGFHVDNTGATAQKACPIGTTTSVVASESCQPCDKGSAASKILDINGNATDVNTCSLCENGYYSDSSGVASCTKCPPLTTTVSWASTSISDCVCTDGTFRTASGNCETCPEGMSCPVGSSASSIGSTMMVQPGYWIPDAQEPIQVYMCHPLRETKENFIGGCKGGGVATCDGLWFGKVCGECDGYRDVENKCRKCEGLDGVGFVIFLVLAFMLSPLTYYLVNSELTSQVSSAALVCISMGTVVTVMQLSAILSQISIAWPSELHFAFELFSIFALDLRFLKPECASLGVRSAASKFYFSLFLLPALGGWIFLVSCITRMISKHDEAAKVKNLILAKKGQKDPNYKSSPWWVMLRPETFNTFGTIYQAAFITVAMTTISPMRCYGHPNGESSLVSDPQVICGEGEHPAMLYMGFVTMLLFVVCFILYYVYVTHKMPQIAAVDPLFYRSRKYMIFRFRSSTWYWGVVFLVRNFFCALTTVVDPNRPYLQTVLFVTVLLTYTVFQVRVWPWKTEGLNIIDLVSSWSMALITFFSSAYVFEASPEDELTALWLVSIFYFVCVGSIVGFFFMKFKEFVQEGLDPKLKASRANKSKDKTEVIGMKFVTMCGDISKIVEMEKRVRRASQEGKTGGSSGPGAGHVVTQFLNSLGTLDLQAVEGVAECVHSECTSRFLGQSGLPGGAPSCNKVNPDMGDGIGSQSSLGQSPSGGQSRSGRISLSAATAAIVSIPSQRSARLSMAHFADDDVNTIANMLQAEQVEQRDGDIQEGKDGSSVTAGETEVDNAKKISGEETQV